jgi:hypothetical protein
MKNRLLNTDFTALVSANPVSSFATATDIEIVSRWYVTQDPKSGTPPTVSVARTPFAYPLAGGVPADGAVSYLSAAVADLGSSLGTGYYWRLEGRTHARELRNQRATFSFWAKATVANTQIAVILRRSFGPAGSADQILKAQTFNLSTTWQRYGFNLAVSDIPAGTIVAGGSFLGFGIYLFGDTTSLSPLVVGLSGTVGTVSIGLPQWEANNLTTYEGNDSVRALGAGAVKATGTLTFTGQPADTETVVLGGTTYTYKTTLTATANQVKIGTTEAISIQNLRDAINALPGGAGTTYGTGTTANVSASAKSVTATTLVAEALVSGTAGNSIASTETVTNASWGASTLAGGVVPTLDY